MFYARTLETKTCDIRVYSSFHNYTEVITITYRGAKDKSEITNICFS